MGAPLFTFVFAYVTTPIFYVNAAPHIGHLYSMVLADTFHRYWKLRDMDSIFATGTDEHGLKIQQAAAKQGKTPQVLCEEVSGTFKDLANAGNVQYTDFIRTTEPRHKVAVQTLWTQLLDQGYIYKGHHEGWYSVSDEAFYAENQVVQGADPVTKEPCKVSMETGSRVEWNSEENYKFRLSTMAPLVQNWLRDNPGVIQPVERYNEVLASLSTPTSDLSVSRPAHRLGWGIPVPNDPSHTIYVWMDALTNYLTVTGYPQVDPRDPGYKGHWPAHTHLVGKDIIRFHSVYWPAFLMAAGLPLPKRILAHAHWTMDKAKMSKSRGNVADPYQFLQDLGQDGARFYLVRDGGMTNDADYSMEMALRRYKKELAGQLGNLLTRSTSPALNPTGTVPQALYVMEEGNGQEPKGLREKDRALYTSISQLPSQYEKHMEEGHAGKAVAAVFDMLSEANRHFSDHAPWKLKETPEQVVLRSHVVWWAMEACRTAGILLQPVMPERASRLLDLLSIPPSQRYWKDLGMGKGWRRDDGAPEGDQGLVTLPPSEVLFPSRKK
ncbi:tRNA synthetases class I (M)-domain-containing protein [Piptocephalis cylindrospora]|uniref:Probable methionine--tRNA ligase, mitochondrial n=1 Tax=Piptocephalis cylindrospora TaxID=1907219 RepID=A0A4P9Y392_9FUNG|nr:tRNA synthetases class I (M)-domain-containing protein [Piptocephalis cylindrospora]|eukprot:RKP13154.1 tRNA synthetases class I (M)-domain-containing protein [Piptocephalis cylindrospora]